MTETLESLLASSGLDERTRLLLSLMSRNPPAEQADEEQDEVAALNERFHRLRRRYRLMRDEYRELQHRNTVLSRALGACPNCWGEEPRCAQCLGRGRPGAFRCDPELFDAIVAPVIADRSPDVAFSAHPASDIDNPTEGAVNHD